MVDSAVPANALRTSASNSRIKGQLIAISQNIILLSLVYLLGKFPSVDLRRLRVINELRLLDQLLLSLLIQISSPLLNTHVLRLQGTINIA